MNYAVVRAADTRWGSAFAYGLARHKRHLILLGGDKKALDDLAADIQVQFNIRIYCFLVSEFDVFEVISVCGYINDHFEVDFLVNYNRDGHIANMMDTHVNRFVMELTGAFLAGPLFRQQLMPNLMLHGDATILELRSSYLDPACVMEHGSRLQGFEEVNSVKTIFKELPEMDQEILSGRDFCRTASDLLRSILMHETETAG